MAAMATAKEVPASRMARKYESTGKFGQFQVGGNWVPNIGGLAGLVATITYSRVSAVQKTCGFSHWKSSDSATAEASDRFFEMRISPESSGNIWKSPSKNRRDASGKDFIATVSHSSLNDGHLPWIQSGLAKIISISLDRLQYIMIH